MTTKRLNRCKVEWMKILKPNGYVLLDKILFQSNLTEANKGDGFHFHIRTLAKECSISPRHIIRYFKMWPFIEKVGKNRSMVITLNYDLFMKWIGDIGKQSLVTFGNGDGVIGDIGATLTGDKCVTLDILKKDINNIHSTKEVSQNPVEQKLLVNKLSGISSEEAIIKRKGAIQKLVDTLYPVEEAKLIAKVSEDIRDKYKPSREVVMTEVAKQMKYHKVKL